MADRWLSVDEIAEYLGISKDTVYTWVNERGMPGHKVGRLWKFMKRTSPVIYWNLRRWCGRPKTKSSLAIA